MGTNLLDALGACAFPALETATFSRQLFDATINGKSKAKQATGAAASGSHAYAPEPPRESGHPDSSNFVSVGRGAV